MQEKSLVRMSMFLIIVSFIFVYTIFLDKNKNIFSTQDGPNTQWVIVSDNDSALEGEVIDLTSSSSDNKSPSNIDPTEQELLYQIQWEAQSSWWVKILSGTTLVYDELPTVTKFNLNPKYILKWKWTIYFVNLGKGDIEFDLVASKFAGGTKYIIDMNHIRNVLGLNFDNIRFINLPTWKDQLVVFVTKVGWDNRLIQSSPEDYYA